MSFIKRIKLFFFLRKEVVDFAIQMETNLRDNDHKKHWLTCEQVFLWGKLYEEICELLDAWNGGKDVLAEAADVANITMMLADIHKLYGAEVFIENWPSRGTRTL